jgi:hypothetical protein
MIFITIHMLIHTIQILQISLIFILKFEPGHVSIMIIENVCQYDSSNLGPETSVPHKLIWLDPFHSQERHLYIVETHLCVFNSTC